MEPRLARSDAGDLEMESRRARSTVEIESLENTRRFGGIGAVRERRGKTKRTLSWKGKGKENELFIFAALLEPTPTKPDWSNHLTPFNHG